MQTAVDSHPYSAVVMAQSRLGIDSNCPRHASALTMTTPHDDVLGS